MDDSVIVPPAFYESIWFLILLIVVASVAAYYALALLLTRPKKAKKEKPTSLTYREELRAQALADIEEAYSLFGSKEISPRELNQKLGVLLRAFATEYSGVSSKSMTLTELRRNGMAPELVEAITKFYPIAFKANYSQTDPKKAVELAREVVEKWS